MCVCFFLFFSRCLAYLVHVFQVFAEMLLVVGAGLRWENTNCLLLYCTVAGESNQTPGFLKDAAGLVGVAVWVGLR